MHPARPSRLRCSWPVLVVIVGEVAPRFCDEALAAFGATKEIALAAMLGPMRRRCRIDAHAANRIAHRFWRILSGIGGAIARIGSAHKSDAGSRVIPN